MAPRSTWSSRRTESYGSRYDICCFAGGGDALRFFIAASFVFRFAHGRAIMMESLCACSAASIGMLKTESCKVPVKKRPFSKFAVIIFALFLSSAYVPFFFLGSSSAEDPLKGYVQIPADEKVALVEDPRKSAGLRLALIKNASRSIKISYHTFSEGIYSSMFVKELLEAADRGVKIDFINDGIIGGMPIQARRTAKALNSHENIDIYFYEPFSPFPYSWNNRLHDKFLLVDGTYLLTGGRNISDKTFMPEGFSSKVVFDRDILIVGKDGKGVIGELQHYIDALLSSKYAKKMRSAKKNDDVIEDLIRSGQENEMLHPELAEPIMDLRFFETESIDLIANPIGRGSKECVIWNELLDLFRQEEDSIILQSPYVVLYPFQIAELCGLPARIEIITNSPQATPNFFAYPHYLAMRPSLEDFAYIYEYAGEGSVHTKSFIVGNSISIIGSFNLDPRSLYLDTETMYVIKSQDFTKELLSVTGRWKTRTEAKGLASSSSENEPHPSSWLKYAFLRLLSFILFPLFNLV